MKAKFTTLIIALFVAISGVIAQTDIEELSAFFIGFEEARFIFEDEDSNPIEFIDCPREIIKKFDLKGEKSKNQAFLITFYENEDFDYVIQTLEKTTLKKIEIEFYEEPEEDK